MQLAGIQEFGRLQALARETRAIYQNDRSILILPVYFWEFTTGRLLQTSDGLLTVTNLGDTDEGNGLAPKSAWAWGA